MIKKIPYPTNIKELRAILGKFTYYKNYIKDFAQIAAPLTNLLHGHENKIKHVENVVSGSVYVPRSYNSATVNVFVRDAPEHVNLAQTITVGH